MNPAHPKEEMPLAHQHQHQDIAPIMGTKELVPMQIRALVHINK